jgi:hypothetical protein
MKYIMIVGFALFLFVAVTVGMRHYYIEHRRAVAGARSHELLTQGYASTPKLQEDEERWRAMLWGAGAAALFVVIAAAVSNAPKRPDA